jgi:hypothetical protein
MSNETRPATSRWHVERSDEGVCSEPTPLHVHNTSGLHTSGLFIPVVFHLLMLGDGSINKQKHAPTPWQMHFVSRFDCFVMWS